MNAILAKIFEFFKTKSPKIYAIFIAVIALVWTLDGQGVINIPQAIEDILISLGFVTGVHTSAIIKNEK